MSGHPAGSAASPRLDALVTGEAVRIAHAAARAALHAPGRAFEPLVVVGPAGSGKSALLAALAADWTAHGVAARHVSLDALGEAWRVAVAAGEGEAFRAGLVAAEALLVDDLQLLAGDADLQRELLRVLQLRRGDGRQLVVAADRAPTTLPDLDPRLAQRLAAGLVVHLGLPDGDMRVRLLEAEAARLGLALPEGTLEAAAGAAAGRSAHELLGVLQRLRAEQDAGGVLEPGVAAAITAELVEGPGGPVAGAAGGGEFGDLLSEVAGVFGDDAAVREAPARPPRAGPGTITREQLLPPPGPAPLFRLDDLLEGAANHVALRLVREVVESPGTRANPLVVVGGTGSGKTHLLHGLGNALAELLPGPVACLAASALADELAEARDRERTYVWRARYRRVEALLIDDLEGLAGHRAVQEELVALVDPLLQGGAQVVVALSAPPEQVQGLEPRLVGRLAGGLLVTLPPPDRELRQRVLDHLLLGGALEVEPEAVAWLAGLPADSVRALHGLAQHVRAQAEAAGGPLTLARAQEIVQGAPAD
ncbi:MAG: DnaA/Hda family protein, partial [Gemmatimonadales bacterium]|nr:DnaA/Hda family protein [Gemmatimonadales bacterium]